MDSGPPGPSDSTRGFLVVHAGRMHTLVTAASKHGSAHEVAKAIAHRLEDAGHSVDVVAPAAVEPVDPCDVVVCGSAVYILQWMDEVKSFLKHFAEQLKTERVWAFSAEMNGVPKHAPQDPTRIGPALTHILAIDKRTFAGHHKLLLLPPRERSVARLTGVVEGDFRDWNEIEVWADSIVAELSDKD